MPPSNAVLQAILQRLMAQGENTLSRAGGAGQRIVNPAGETVGVIPDPGAAAQAVTSSRAAANAAQGTDPLAARAALVDEPRQKVYQLQQFIDDAYGQVGMATRNQKGFNEADAITRGSGTTAVTQHSDPFGGPDYSIETILDDIEGAARVTPRADPSMVAQQRLFDELVAAVQGGAKIQDIAPKLQSLQNTNPRLAGDFVDRFMRNQDVSKFIDTNEIPF